VCEARFGHSTLADVIRAEVDPHCYTAAMMRGMKPDEFLAMKATQPEQYEADRRRAKAVNFGIPGGLGPARLAEYAKTTFGVQMTEDEAAELRLTIVERIYPEWSQYLQEDLVGALAHNLACSEDDCWQALDFSGTKNARLFAAIRRIVAGHRTKTDMTPYNSRWIEQVWDHLRSINRNRRFNAALSRRVGSLELANALFQMPVATLTGRLRANVTFCQARNTPFQGLAADGAKLALFDLIAAGYAVVAFVHDEVVVELREDCDLDHRAREVRQILEHGMRRVVGVLPVRCELAIARSWTKNAKPRFEGRRLVVWEPGAEVVSRGDVPVC
jgi:hypothetical protein